MENEMNLYSKQSMLNVKEHVKHNALRSKSNTTNDIVLFHIERTCGLHRNSINKSPLKRLIVSNYMLGIWTYTRYHEQILVHIGLNFDSSESDKIETKPTYFIFSGSWYCDDSSFFHVWFFSTFKINSL